MRAICPTGNCLTDAVRSALRSNLNLMWIVIGKTCTVTDYKTHFSLVYDQQQNLNHKKDSFLIFLI